MKEQTQYNFLALAFTYRWASFGTTDQNRGAVTLSLHQALAGPRSESTLPGTPSLELAPILKIEKIETVFIAPVFAYSYVPSLTLTLQIRTEWQPR